LQELTALFQPFSLCDEYINAHFFKNEMSDCMQYAIKFIEKLTDENLKDKEVGCLFDLLKTLKTLLRRCNLIDTSLIVDTLRLTMTLRMFHIPHFNAKMNALKEVVRLTEEPYSAARAGVKTPIPAEKVRSWLISNKVLSIAFGGNLHQAQYCDKVKSIVEFLGNDLSSDELHTIWDMQVDKNPAQIENIHNILAYAASRFSQQHMDILLQLIQQSWETASSDRYREKLLGLIGKIGKDDRTGRTASKILEMLWGLAHLSQLSRQMVELALNSHYSILIDSFHIKDSDKRVYIGKCVEDIKKCQWVVFAINQLHRLSKGMFRSRYGHKDQQQIADLQKQYDLLRLISSTLAKLHARAVQNCQENGETFSGDTLVDGRFTLEECVDTHLQFMHFLLQDGSLYLPFKRANEIWETLIANPDACSTDRRLGFKWFDLSMGDLELESQQNLFHKRVLRVDPLILDVAGYHCIRNFFESINLSERKLRKLQHSHQLIIDNPDLTGIDYLWKAALEVKDNYIADELISHILQITYNSLTPKLKKDPVMLHQRVIDECFTRLDSLIGPPEGYDPNLRIQCIERLLLLTQRYITMVEESHSYPRQILPHGACFQGHSIRLHVSVDQQQTSFSLQCHTNEMLSSVRRKIADRLKLTPEQLQIGTSEKWMMSPQYNKLLHQLKFDNGQLIIVKTTIIGTFGNITDSAANVERLKIALKQERLLPGVIMATERDIFSKLETLCKLEEPRITAVVRALLSLLPINQKVLEALEVFIHPSTSQGATDDTGPQPSPQHVLDSLFNASNILPTILVYNIEVLSGKLMPANRSPSETSASLFRHNFSEAGGLKCILGILQNFSSSVDSAVQQDCYAITLSLAKHLLCATPTQPDTATEEAEAVESSPHPSLSNRQLSKTKSVEDETARLIIEMMSVEDFQMTLLCLMKVCWAAVAGELHLATEKDGSRLKAGICSKCLSVPLKNIGIARESLELLVTCLKLRQSDMTIFYNLPGIEDFIMDILLGSVHYELRQLMADYMFDLCQEVNIFSSKLYI
jgi:ubiquitin carboxyl-terminal hydrolase 9/24